jgi:glycosyltransferase involved in cell wall biosynthesis
MNFSVLMSVYYKDNPLYLKQAIESVVNQTYKASEIVLVKDGQLTKELDDVINEYQMNYKNLLIVLQLKTNMGLGDALQVGLLKCTNEIIARMDSDDICELNRFEKQIKEFEKDKELALLGGIIEEFIDDPMKPISKRMVPYSVEEINDYLKKRCPFNHMTVMFRKSAVLKVGGYIKWFNNEDYSLWVRLIASGAKTRNLQDILVHVRVNTDSYGRRGGWKYFKSEETIQRDMLKRRMISPLRYLINITIRLFVQMFIPNNVRALIYRKLLRS